MTRPGPSHAYPLQLASFVIARLEELEIRPLGLTFPEDIDVVESVLSVAYQVSLLRDEDRPLTFRIAIAAPDLFDDTGGPPRSVHPLRFTAPRPFAVHELKKLVPAVKYPRSVVAAYPLEDKLTLWGLVNTGARWLHVTRGGRGAAPELPLILVVHVNGPGNLVVNVGTSTLARLYAGQVTIPMLDVFDSKWLSEMFAPVRSEVSALHLANAPERGEWADVDPELIRHIGQNFVRRIISTIRSAKHGGSVLILPQPRISAVCSGALVELKYKFEDAEPRRRFRALLVSALSKLARSRNGREGRIGWAEYESSHLPEIGQIDEAVMEMAHLVSALADVDGVVVMTRRFEIIGFGGVVSGTLPEVSTISEALDLEGQDVIEESTDGMGTRHRAAYRIVAATKDALCVVVSQDGGVRFVRWHGGGVMYWDQVAAQTFG